jgi:hypothetical protein
MVLLSQFPIDARASRTLQQFLYKDMPGAVLPTDPTTGQPWYSQEDLQVCRMPLSDQQVGWVGGTSRLFGQRQHILPSTLLLSL